MKLDMNKTVSAWLVVTFTLWFVVSCTTQLNVPESSNSLNFECYKTFEEFAYGGFDSQPIEELLPTEPWHIESTMPSDYYGDATFNQYDWQVRLVRLVRGNPEIWLSRERGASKEVIPLILIYYPMSKRWSSVSGIVEDSDIFVKDIYMTSDGTVWGKNRWLQDQNNTPNQGSILSKYNEQTHQFQFVLNAPQISFAKENRASDIRVHLSRTGIFWIAVESDGLYTYDPQLDQTTKQAELGEMPVGVMSSASDGTVYFASTSYEQLQFSQPPFHMHEGMLIQFSVDSGKFIALENPSEPWPAVGPPLVTKSNQLWLGSVGYKDLNENRWYRLLPEINVYTEESYLNRPGSPQVMLEDAFGILWFGSDTEAKDGIAWYDLETGKGCMFANFYANIVEDSRQQLWMFADGNLYKLSRE